MRTPLASFASLGGHDRGGGGIGKLSAIAMSSTCLRSRASTIPVMLERSRFSTRSLAWAFPGPSKCK